MFIEMFKYKLYFCLKGEQEDMCLFTDVRILQGFSFVVVVLLTVSELDLTEWNQPDSGAKTDQMQDMILFSSETMLQRTFSEAL